MVGGSADEKKLVHKYIRSGYTIFGESSGTFTELGVVSSVDATTGDITLSEDSKVTIGTAQNLHYTSTGDLKSVNSTIVTVGSPASDGYSLCVLASSGNHILTGNTFTTDGDALLSGANSQHALLGTVSDIFVAHRLGNFQNDGPITKTFIYSDTGVKLTFGEYRIWYERYQNYIQPLDRKKQAISGRQGWVGNFGLDTNGRKTLGISLNGASSLQRGRQYNSSMWLTAVPVHARWESSSYATYMLQSDKVNSIDSNYLDTTTVSLDGAGTNKLYPLNHSRLTTGAIYAGINTGDVLSGGAGAYDTQHYRFASTGIRLTYSLQDGTVSSDGTVTGGSNARLSEQLVLSGVTNYSPVFNLREAAKGPGTATGIATNSNTFSLSATNSKALLPGDALYTGSNLYQGNFIGIVESVDYTSGEITLTDDAKTTQASGAINAISPRGYWADSSGPTSAQKFDSVSLVFSGEAETGAITLQQAGASLTSPNVIGGDPSSLANSSPGYNRYNFRFGVGKRVYNQSTLLNTFTNLRSVNTFESASNVVDVRFGDLATYTSPMLNVEVTRFNPKTHIESSTSVTGPNLHI